ncbi:cadherin-like domain-containing protein [Pseudovibrio exalbescens]|uniref:cadherin-like domain-containing protein n=1 Tax=Pseudovibrio exalbescens TaxID=197461 RepID=UPI0023662746|nr:cadherin-like domain-containing protein [Pseudovibrio exalbescens]MDD7910757.1 cadherin-like domain-containing protein [Pseudovibrio exalbescens]
MVERNSAQAGQETSQTSQLSGSTLGGGLDAAARLQIIQFPSGQTVQLQGDDQSPRDWVLPENGVFRVPLTASIADGIRLGDDLLFRQPDGTVLILKDGALGQPQFFVGETPINVVLLPPTEDADGNVETGAIAVEEQATEASSGGNFSLVIPEISPGFPISPLLPPTELAFPEIEDRELADGDDLDPPDIFLGFDDGSGFPSVVGAFEDQDGPGDSGATVNLGLNLSVSRGGASVTIVFADMPAGATVNGGTLAPGGVWTGSLTEANELEVYFPPDYSGTIEAEITVTGDGASESGNFDIVIDPTPDIEIDTQPIALSETDAPVPFKPADYISVTQSDADGSEVIESITVTFSDLPQGTSVSAGSLDGNGNFTFTGTPAEFAALEITLPTDFSTQNPGLVLQGTVTATSNEGTGPTEPITLSLAFEGDVAVGYTDQVDQSSGAPTIVLSETDTGTDPLLVSLGDYFTAQATDADGSESLTTVSFEITDLPDGAQFSTDGGTTFSTANISGGTLTYTGPASGLANLVLSLPADFSTENPQTSISGTFTANTDEGGTASAPFGILVNFEPDIELSAQDVTGAEDGDGAGVTVDLGISSAITDADLSEGDANTPDTVTITFDRLPDGTTANVGTLDVAGLSWTGSVTEANQLALTFPEDFSTESGSGGTDPIMVTTTVATPEGKETVTSTITVKEASDIDIDTQPIALSETDAPVPFKPVDYISVTQSDADGSEVIESITVTFSDLPPGTSVSAGSLDGNGNFTFTGTPAEFAALEITLPTDFSTQNPGPVLQGTVTATSNEGTGPTEPITLSLAFEGDVAVGYTDQVDQSSGAPTIVLNETDTGTDPLLVSLGDYFTAQATDADGSESLTTVSFEITDLPNGAQFSTDGGTTFSTANISGGTLTYTGPASGLANLVLSLPADFSTENPQTSISGTFTANTDEGGTASAPFGILVNFEPDIILSAPDVCEPEDGDGVGVTVDLGISAAITDADLSEGDANTPDTVTITFDRLPDGTTANVGTLDVAGLSWTGSVAEANQLALNFPEDFSTESGVFTPTGSNLIVNGSFEDPDLPQGDWGSYPSGNSVPGWGGTRIEIQDRYQGRVASEGEQYAELDAERAVDTLFQDVSAETGETYLLSVDIAARRGGTETIEVYWNNQKIATLEAQGPEWVTHTFKVTGEAGLDRLEFRELASENDTYGGFIDNVQLVKGDFAPGEPIKVTTTVTTPEGQETVNSTIKIQASEDIDLSTKDVSGVEDADGPGDVGVTIALAITADISDQDGSEGDNDTPNTVVLTFDRLPAGTTANAGTLDVGNLTWTGSVNEANALSLTFPPDFSTESSPDGTPETPIAVTSTVTTPEGSESSDFAITIAPTQDIDVTANTIRATETDAPLAVKPADFIQITVSDADGSEEVQSLTLVLNDLPSGTTASAGVIDSAGTLTFTGTLAEFNALVVTLPTDFSTQNPGPDLKGSLTATSNEGFTVTPVTLAVDFEGDVAVGYTDQVDQSSGAPTIVLSETDTGTDPLLVSLGDYFTAQATDADGSESLTTVSFEITDLPDGAQFSTDGGTTFSTANISGGTLTYTGPASGLANLVLSLPADFSTENPQTSISGTFTANTDEGGTASAPFGILVNFEPDIELSAQDVTGAEDGDGAGVTVDLGISSAITDADLSEGDANTPDTVTITFDRLPDGTTANVGTLDVAGLSWTGSVTEANQLALTFPEDFSTESGSGGTDPIMVTTTVATPEGKETVTSTITVKEASDIDIDTQPIALSETDAPVPFKPVDYISVTQSDADGSEVIESITVTFSDLPPGTSVSAGSLDGNGNFTFTGTPAEFAALEITLPTDFSTQNPGPVLQGTVTATSNEGTGPTEPITLSLAFEGDVAVGYTDQVDQSSGAPTIVLNETDTGTDPLLVSLGDYFTAQATDADGSESLTTVSFEITDLPNGAQFSTDGGTTFSTANISGGTLTYTGPASGLANLVLSLPADFSTENPQTSISGTFTANTDEGGTASAPFGILVNFEPDIELSAQDVTGTEDGDGAGVTVDLGISSAITDADLSEGDANTPDTVTITFDRLPDGTTANGGTLDVAGLSWTGSVAEANQLALTFPEDFSTESSPVGTAETVIAVSTTVETPEGQVTVNSTIDIAATEDIDLTAQDKTVDEDSGPIALKLGLAITDSDFSEQLAEPVSITFTGLPNAASFNAGSYDGNTGVWTGTLAEYTALTITDLPEHFSGVIGGEVTANSNEGSDTATFKVNVLPIAEPTITMSVTAVDTAGDVVIAKEDMPFTVSISAQTPDQDGSESLSTIVISNVPDGWVALSNGNTVASGAFASGGSDVQSAAYNSATGDLTITLKPGLQTWSGSLTMKPSGDTDLDVSTLMGGDMTATVTSIDTASGLPSDTETASDTVEVDVDAVIDDPDIRVSDQRTNEDLNSVGQSRLRFNRLRLGDTDGSESYGTIAVTIALAETASDSFNLGNDVSLFSSASSNRGDIALISSNATSATYEITQPDGVSDAQFQGFVQNLRISYPQNFSGVFDISGTVEVKETNTPVTQSGDNEYDTSDNTLVEPFSTQVTVQPKAEAELTVTLVPPSDGFVTTPENDPDSNVVVQPGDKTPIVEINEDSSVDLQIAASTPDTDGSEEISVITVVCIPNGWFPYQSNGIVDPSILGPEASKIQQAFYDETTGNLILTFVDGVTSFNGTLTLTPLAHDDRDADAADALPGQDSSGFFGDIGVEMTVVDSRNTVGSVQDVRQVSVTVDIDVEAVNDPSVLPDPPPVAENTVDAAGGFMPIPLAPTNPDMDGSETIEAVVINGIPKGMVVFYTDAGGNLVPAKLTSVDNTNGTTSWTLESGQWQTAVLSGVPTHFSGVLTADPATGLPVRSADGSTTIEARVTTREFNDGEAGQNADTPLIIEVTPSVDGGNPNQTFNIMEDQRFNPNLDGNLIDKSDQSPEELTGDVVITLGTGIPNSVGEEARFFLDDPSGGASTEIFLNGDGELIIPSDQIGNFVVVPPKDSNEDFTLGISYEVREATDPTGPTKTETGTLTFNVKGVADTPTITVPAGGEAEAYVGDDSGAFLLDTAKGGAAGNATRLGGMMTEILPDGINYDGSENLYFVITGDALADVPSGGGISTGTPAVTFQNGIDTGSGAVIVSAADIGNLEFVPSNVNADTDYKFTLTAIVVENDESIPGGISLGDAALLHGVAVAEADFYVHVEDVTSGGGGDGCDINNLPPVPDVTLVDAVDGMSPLSGVEDQALTFTLQLNNYGGDWGSLPGETSITLDGIPNGATLTASDPAAVVYNPVTGTFVINTDAVTDATVFSLQLPEHVSSANTPFDGVDEISHTSLSLNVKCGFSNSVAQTTDVYVEPVADAPKVTVHGTSGNEDTLISISATVALVDPGETLGTTAQIQINTTDGVIADSAGNPLTPSSNAGGVLTYDVPLADLNGLFFKPTAELHGDFPISITATSVEPNGDTASTTRTGTIHVEAVADAGQIDFDPNLPTDTDNGDLLPVVETLEDMDSMLSSVVTAMTPDQDGSEVYSVTLLGVPDYLTVSAGIDNGLGPDGLRSYTLTPAEFAGLKIGLADQHARTPDALDPSLPDQVRLTLHVNTLELSNGDTNSGEADFLFKVVPDADVPTVEVSDASTTEDTAVALSISGAVTDPHEVIAEYVIRDVPNGAQILVNGVAVATGPSEARIPAADIGNVEFLPGPDNSGQVTLKVVSVSSEPTVADQTAANATEESAVADLVVTITPEEDIDLVTQDVSGTEDADGAGVTIALGITAAITDADGSEGDANTPDTVSITFDRLPTGTTANGGALDVAGLEWTGSVAEANALSLTFPQDYSTGTAPGVNSPIQMVTTVTTSEGSESSNSTISVEPSADVSLSVAVSDAAQDGSPTVVPIDVMAGITDAVGPDQETLDQVEIVFSGLPAGASFNSGSLNGDTLTVSRSSFANEVTFIAALTALAVTLPSDFFGDITAQAQGTSSEGKGSIFNFGFNVNAQPDVPSVVLDEPGQEMFIITEADLLSTATDPDGNNLSVSNVQLTSSDGSIKAGTTPGTWEVTVNEGYTGALPLTFDVTDDAGVPAMTAATGSINVSNLNTIQLTDSGADAEVTTGVTGDLLDDADGTSNVYDVASGTNDNDVVIVDGTRDYQGIDAFELSGGQDLLDLSQASRGFEGQLGSGDDFAVGSDFSDVLRGDAGNDRLEGGAGSDLLEGGSGADTFVISTVDAMDTIADYNSGEGDVVDLTGLFDVSGSVSDYVNFDSSTGQLSVDVDGNTNGANFINVVTIDAFGGGTPGSVTVAVDDGNSDSNVIV